MLMLNARAAAMVPARRVLLLFDESTSRLAIRATHDDDDRSFRLNHLKSAANISCRAFVTHYGLPLGSAFELLPGEDGMLVAAVNNECGKGS